jgi:hypothetical protein
VIPCQFIFSVAATSTYDMSRQCFGLTHYTYSALISRDNIRAFDEANWVVLKGKSSAPKFKLALTEARKSWRKLHDSVAEGIFGLDVKAFQFLIRI